MEILINVHFSSTGENFVFCVLMNILLKMAIFNQQKNQEKQ